MAEIATVLAILKAWPIAVGLTLTLVTANI
jgi:hypothetical protein